MALKVISPGLNPIGIFDGLDADVSAVKGGEVLGMTFVSRTGTDKAAKDVADGYTSNTRTTRPCLTKSLVSGMRPLYLCDEGTTGYGTQWGQVVGASVGQQVTGGVVLGPNTALGSGKLTAWDKPGLYGVTLDACDVNENTGLQPTNTTLNGGAALYASSAGLLTPNVSNAFESIVVARFIEFATNGSYVNTPSYLTSALNSPVSNVSTLGGLFTQAVFYFSIET